MLQRVQHIKGHVFGNTQRQPRFKKGYVRPIWKKISIFFELEYWKFFPVRHILDVMHIEKNICEALLGTLLNIPEKTKDREFVRLDMAAMENKNGAKAKKSRKKGEVTISLMEFNSGWKKKLFAHPF